MPFVVGDLQDLIRLLEQHPEWKGALRASLLGEEVLQLPFVVRELAEAQKRTEQRVEELAQAQKRTEQRVEELTEAQKRTEQRVEELVQAQKRTEQALARLTSEVADLKVEVAGLKKDVGALKVDVAGLKVDVGDLKGDSLERRYRERAASYFQRLLRRIRVLDHQQAGDLLDDAVEAGRITPEERADVLGFDVLVTGLRDSGQVYLVAEVSAVVDVRDVERAAQRSEILGRALQAKVLAAVAGTRLSPDAEEQARASGVVVVVDGAVQTAS
ncbi:MAG: hypothetical protein QN163_05480 [Armatimonadota bacterium]|nr:hypothetical protein [Armatimonadota bacterium]MDR5696216.1 hypothetical protein [Armatimonadota bacterium]